MNVPLNIDWQQILLHLLNFVVLFAILYFLLYAPVKKFMDKRTEYYKNLDDEAKKNLQDAENSKKLYAEKLGAADDEIEQKKREADKALSEKEKESLLAAKREADEIISDARKTAENDRKKMLENAQNEIADMVTSATEKIVQASTSDSYEQFLTAAERGREDD